MMNVQNIREAFIQKYKNEEFVVDKNGGSVLEICGASFTADEPFIFGQVNNDYIKRELHWYLSQSLKVDDIGQPVPKIWNQVASTHGTINSNYGYLIYNKKNYFQYENVLLELQNNPNSRRAIMIYTRPSMHNEYNIDGMNDFICTNAVQYLIRDNLCNAIVQMRSNDAWAGYRNDYAWQKFVLDELVSDYNSSDTHPKISPGSITWQVGSLHLYDRQYYLIKDYIHNNEH